MIQPTDEDKAADALRQDRRRRAGRGEGARGARRRRRRRPGVRAQRPAIAAPDRDRARLRAGRHHGRAGGRRGRARLGRPARRHRPVLGGRGAGGHGAGRAALDAGAARARQGAGPIPSSRRPSPTSRRTRWSPRGRSPTATRSSAGSRPGWSSDQFRRAARALTDVPRRRWPIAPAYDAGAAMLRAALPRFSASAGALRQRGGSGRWLVRPAAGLTVRRRTALDAAAGARGRWTWHSSDR